MKLIFLILWILFAILLFTQCQQPRPSAETSPDPGAKLFLRYCSRCHQDNGMGGPATGGLDARDIRQSKRSEGDLQGFIKNGWGEMPAFGDSVSAENIALIAHYVATNIEGHPATTTTGTGGMEYLHDSLK